MKLIQRRAIPLPQGVPIRQEKAVYRVGRAWLFADHVSAERAQVSRKPQTGIGRQFAWRPAYQLHLIEVEWRKW